MTVNDNDNNANTSQVAQGIWKSFITGKKPQCKIKQKKSIISDSIDIIKRILDLS